MIHPKQHQLLTWDAKWDANWDTNWDTNWDSNWDTDWDANWDANQHPKQFQILKGMQIMPLKAPSRGKVSTLSKNDEKYTKSDSGRKNEI